MTKSKTLKSMAVYELLERQMIWLIAIFGILAIVCSLMTYRYGNLKSKAEEIEKIKLAREMKWTDENKNVAAIRFTCYHGSEDLGFLYGTVKITKVSGGNGFQNGEYNIIAKEAELYLPEGNYKVELKTNEYENAYLEVSVADSEIGLRKWYTFKLERTAKPEK